MGTIEPVSWGQENDTSSRGVFGEGGTVAVGSPILLWLEKSGRKASSSLLSLLEEEEKSASESMPGKGFVSSLLEMASELSRWLRESGVPITRLVNKKRRKVCMASSRSNDTEFFCVCERKMMQGFFWFCPVKFVFAWGRGLGVGGFYRER